MFYREGFFLGQLYRFNLIDIDHMCLIVHFDQSGRYTSVTLYIYICTSFRYLSFFELSIISIIMYINQTFIVYRYINRFMINDIDLHIKPKVAKKTRK